MRNFIRSVMCASAFACIAAAQTASFFPLKEGNTWIYREVGGPGSFAIQVGTPLATGDGKVYHHLNGYVSQKLFVRKHESGNLYWYNDEFPREEILTSFEFVRGGRFNAPFRPCGQEEGEVLEERVPAMRFGDADGGALAIKYISHGCADAGIVEELYVENIGLVKRTVLTIAGPKTFELVYARLGDMQIVPDNSTTFTVDLSPQPFDPEATVVSMTLSTRSPAPLQLRFDTSQDYDVVVRNEAGEEIYRWSDGKAFLQIVRLVTVSGTRHYVTRIPLPVTGGNTLPEGNYTLEAWIASGDSHHQFSAVVPFEIRKPKPPEEGR